MGQINGIMYQGIKTLPTYFLEGVTQNLFQRARDGEGPDWLKGPKDTRLNTNIVGQSLDAKQKELIN